MLNDTQYQQILTILLAMIQISSSIWQVSS